MRNIFVGSNIHFVGIGGISMSALANIAADLGAKVTGSDISPNIAAFAKKGIVAYNGINRSIVKESNILVYSQAVSESHEELVFARQEGIAVLSRANFLAFIATQFDKVLAISGTHGKTTTTSMLANIFQESNEPYSAHIGGISNNLGSNYRLSGYNAFITEACEYKRSFCCLSSDIALISNIEQEHLDCYKDLKEIYDAFGDFVNGVRKGGTLVVGDSVNISRLSVPSEIGVYRYGIGKGDFFAYGVQNIEKKSKFDIFIKGKYHTTVTLNVLGLHNVINATGAFATAYLYGINSESIVKGLGTFSGVQRRMEEIVKADTYRIYLDYAHHPSELKAAIDCFDNVEVIFEPHTYSRTKYLFEDFVEVLKTVNSVALLPTYAAREDESEGVDAFSLFAALPNERKEYLSDYSLARKYIKKLISTSSNGQKTILLLGAGSIDKLADSIRNENAF